MHAITVSLCVNHSNKDEEHEMSSAVHIPAQEFTPDQMREIVTEYVTTPHGHKAQFAESVGVTQDKILTWRAAMADGDIDNGKIPRKTGRMTRDDVAEIKRLQQQLDDQQATHAREVAAKDDEIARLSKAADSLGKAISALHGLSGQHGAADEH